jgi:hypothetical protein
LKLSKSKVIAVPASIIKQLQFGNNKYAPTAEQSLSSPKVSGDE